MKIAGITGKVLSRSGPGQGRPFCHGKRPFISGLGLGLTLTLLPKLTQPKRLRRTECLLCEVKVNHQGQLSRLYVPITIVKTKGVTDIDVNSFTVIAQRLNNIVDDVLRDIHHSTVCALVQLLYR
jgi:hypothetical protein